MRSAARALLVSSTARRNSNATLYNSVLRSQIDARACTAPRRPRHSPGFQLVSPIVAAPPSLTPQRCSRLHFSSCHLTAITVVACLWRQVKPASCSCMQRAPSSNPSLQHADGALLSAFVLFTRYMQLHVKHHTSHLTPHTSHLTPHTSHLTPHTSHFTPHTSHVHIRSC